MSTDVAVLIEASGNAAMFFTAAFFAAFGAGVKKINGLVPGLWFVALYAATNVFYAVAYWGTTGGGGFNIWDTSWEQLARAAQILSVFAIPVLMLFATRALIRGDD